ncbi:hypothetical protein [Mycoplasmopsis cynos]|uniref:hypothetical protein n=1 Tax=Mycoplasmopsis cynos TaxID=171284 RepID=UPI002AFF8183|nr:hypothetical protein [Mycoplasmopsis cynos]WQQ14941.1 hypothetical protein RRG42_01200 [Mycoplasmopsis cynos]
MQKKKKKKRLLNSWYIKLLKVEILFIIDVNNLFILEPSIYTEFDNKKFYWDPDSGSVIYLNKNNIEDEIIKKLQNYKIDITNEIEMIKYLKKYKEFHLHLDK